MAGAVNVEPLRLQGKRYLNIKEAAYFLGVKVGTLYQWVSHSPGLADPIPFSKFGTRCLRFPSNDLIEWGPGEGTTILQKLKKQSK